MHSFKFNKLQQADKIEQAIGYRSRKVLRQQVIYFLIFVAIIALAAFYTYDRLRYVMFDGYVKTDVRHHQAHDDLLISSFYVRAGDFVKPGDTLYSYYYLKPIIDNLNANAEPAVVVDGRNMQLRHAQLQSEIDVLRTRVKNLQKQISDERHNVSFGLSSSSHMMDLQRQLNEARTAFDAKLKEAAAVSSALRDLNTTIARSGYNRHGSGGVESISGARRSKNDAQEYFCICDDSALVVGIHMPDYSTAFKGDAIMDLHSLNVRRSNTHILVYVPQDEIDNCTTKDSVEVVFNDDTHAWGRFGIVGLRTEALPDGLRSNFMRQNKVILAQLNLLKGQTVPFWAYTNELPIRVRIDRWKSSHDDTRLWIENDESVDLPSRRYLDTLRVESHRRDVQARKAAEPQLPTRQRQPHKNKKK